GGARHHRNRVRRRVPPLDVPARGLRGSAPRGEPAALRPERPGDLDAGPAPHPDRVDRSLPEALHGRDRDGGGRTAPGRPGQAGGAQGDGVAGASGGDAAVTAGLTTLAWPALYPVLIVTVTCFACLHVTVTMRTG